MSDKNNEEMEEMERRMEDKLYEMREMARVFGELSEVFKQKERLLQSRVNKHVADFRMSFWRGVLAGIFISVIFYTLVK